MVSQRPPHKVHITIHCRFILSNHFYDLSNWLLFIDTSYYFYQDRLTRNLRGLHLEISWSGSPWACGKQLKHYPAFSKNGISIAVSFFNPVTERGFLNLPHINNQPLHLPNNWLLEPLC